MLVMLSMILVLMVTILITLIIREAMSNSPDILSIRNFFLLGLIVFQYTSGAIAMLMHDTSNPFAITNLQTPSIIFTLMLIIFSIGFILIYNNGFISDRMADMVNRRYVHAGWVQLLFLSIMAFATGILCRFVLIYIPYFGTFAFLFGSAFLSLAAGLAAWAWAPRIWNPLPAVVTVSVMLGGILSLMSDSFGRRDILGIGLALVWGAYYSHWRYYPFRKILTRFFAIAVLGAVAMGSYTSTRFAFGLDESVSVSQRIKKLSEADLESGILDLFTGQNAGMYSMYFIRTRPDPYEYDTLHSLKLFFSLPVPRNIWPGKPDGLAITSVDEIIDTGKPDRWNIGPGLVGHFANDNPFIALPIYTMVLAIFFRFIDRLVYKYANDPFVVLPVGVSLGQVIAIPRGELGTFFARAILAIVAGWVAMQLIGAIFKAFSPLDTVDEWGGADFNDANHSNGHDEYEDHAEPDVAY